MFIGRFLGPFPQFLFVFQGKKKICREKIEKNIESSLLVREDHNNNHVSGGWYTAANSGSAATADSCGGFRHLDCCLWILCFWSCCDYYYYFDNLRVRKVFFFFWWKELGKFEPYECENVSIGNIWAGAWLLLVLIMLLFVTINNLGQIMGWW